MKYAPWETGKRRLMYLLSRGPDLGGEVTNHSVTRKATNPKTCWNAAKMEYVLGACFIAPQNPHHSSRLFRPLTSEGRWPTPLCLLGARKVSRLYTRARLHARKISYR